MDRSDRGASRRRSPAQRARRGGPSPRGARVRVARRCGPPARFLRRLGEWKVHGELKRGLRRARAAATLIGLRVALPRWFARRSLDDLLERLAPRGAPSNAAPLAQEALRRDLLRAERLLHRVSFLPSTF